MKNSKKNVILKTEGLAVGYYHKKQPQIVLKDINISIEKGKLVALLGENGIGKSTLLRTISNVQKPLKGSTFINQKNLTNYKDNELATLLGVVLTERLPLSQLTVFELVALGRQPYTNWIDKLSEKDIEKTEEAIVLTEITLLKNKRFQELSDGQLQRVLIARALAQDTDIIILDEPTAHLDIHHTFKIFSLLKNLAKTTGKTILISTHEVNLALKTADEFVLLTNDKCYNGTSDELISQDIFSSLFPKELITFNKELKQFIINTI